MSKLTDKFPKHKRFGLIDQIRRAAVSIPANLAEGGFRIFSKDKAHFTNLAYNSLMDVLNHFYLAVDLNYINKDVFYDFKLKIYKISNQLNSLHKT